MKKLLFLLALPLFISCNDDDVCCVNIDTNVSIKYLNEAGQNLFENDELQESNIDISHRVGDEWVRYFEGNLDDPKGIRVDEYEDGLHLIIFPSLTTNAEGISETRIEFSDDDFDVLRTELDISNNNQVVTRVWYNDELRWETSQGERKFEVVR